MDLVEHAWQELQAAGMVQRDPQVAAAVMALVGSAAAMARSDLADPVDVAEPLVKLLRHETLTPLTDDPREWDDRSVMTGRMLWQSRRNPKAFSEDAGRTYFLVHERQQYGPDRMPVYESVSTVRRPRILRRRDGGSARTALAKPSPDVT